jgi:hypothetical protein
MTKKLFTFVLICTILMVSVFPVYCTSPAKSTGGFLDVPSNYWAYNAIKWMSDNKIVEGAGDGRFLPNRAVTRDEYAKMMVLTLHLKLINPQSESFLDIRKGSWQFMYVETAKPYMTGFRTTSGDYFHPSETAVREDMAVALVKALGFENETADLGLLAQFSDAAAISPNLKKYVSIAVAHNLMVGYDMNGKRVFGPKGGLDRASAATLLYNAFRENEEKITYDEAKVTYDDNNKEKDNTNLATARIKVRISGDQAIVSWDKITSSNFNGYKIVISGSDSTPVYPDNGYLKYITDRNETSVTVRAGDCYNGGDIGGSLKSGVNYYFSITVLYNNGKAAGNVVRAKLPAVECVGDENDNNNDNDSGLTPANIRFSISGDKALISWDKITATTFAGCKVVISRYDSTPEYPDNGYLQYITDSNIHSVYVKAGDWYNGGDIDGELKSNVYYYFSVTVLYNDGNVAGNVIRAKLP